MTETHTSDGAPRPNGMTIEQWLGIVLDSGTVQRVTQHLALVIFALAVRQQCNGVSASVRDLERMTGWSKTMIADHLEELGDVIHTTPGVGRKKSLFELQALIEDAIKTIVKPVVSANARTLEQNSVRQCADATADANPDANFVSAVPDANPDMSANARTLIRTQDQPQPAPETARSITTRATKESPSEIVTSEELASKLAAWQSEHQKQPKAEEPVGSLAGLNGSAEPMISDIMGWMNSADKHGARQWLTTTLHTFGQAVTAQSYQKLKTDIAEGMVISRPLQTWSKIAQRMKAEPKPAPASRDAPSNRRERIRKFAEDAEAKIRAQQQQWSGSK